jgi:hypothetical protein
MLYVYNRYIRTSQVAIPEVDAYDTIHFQCFDCRELAVTCYSRIARIPTHSELSCLPEGFSTYKTNHPFFSSSWLV